MNGAEHPKVEIPDRLKAMIEAVPEFGPDAWEMKNFQNPNNPQMVIMVLVNPFETLIGEEPKHSKFFSKISMMTNRGPLELGFAIPKATSLSEACAMWREAAQAAIVEMEKSMRENSRRIVVPEAAPLPGKKLVLNS